MEDAKWYAVYTKPRWEKKVAENLTASKIENYCPLNKVIRNWSDRKKIVSVPLFTSYVFVHISDTQFATIKKTDGVLSFVQWLGKPAVIRDTEIETIKRFLNDHENVTLEKTEIQVHDNVKVVKGSFLDNEGTVLAIKNNTIRVALPSLGFTMVADFEKQSIAKVPVSNF